MRITVTDTIKIVNLEVDANELVEDVKALVEIEFGLPVGRQALYYDNKEIKNHERLNQLAITEHAMLVVGMAVVPQQPTGKLSIKDMIKNAAQQVNTQGVQPPAPSNERMMMVYKKEAERLKKEIHNDGQRYMEAMERDHEFMEAALSEDVMVLARWLMKKDEEARRKQIEEEKRFIELSKDPFNPEYQRLLETHINKKNIDSNYQHAHEYTPEVFGTVCMLYINASINKVPIQAFVDSGAQSTVMSISCAERCGVMRLVDTRFAGMAVGVGTSKIVGRVHAAEIMIEGKFITCSLTVIENNSCEFLLGLDMLKRFNCLLDLKNNQLVFQDGMIVTKFLPEGEIKKVKEQLPERKGSDSKPNIADQIKIRKLESMGFSRQESLDALKQSGGNEQAAASMLLKKRGGN